MQRLSGFLLIFFLLLPSAYANPSASAYSALSQQLTDQSQALKLPLKDPRIVIQKSKRKLLLYSKKKLLRVYKIGLGFEPVGPKQKEGDGKTPEGDYFIVGKNPQSSFFLSLAINYPNHKDAQAALDLGTIQRGQYESIRGADRRRSTPPWDTPMGGEIFIHGNGSRSDWTLGCIALENEEMKELYQAIPKGTPVTILP